MPYVVEIEHRGRWRFCHGAWARKKDATAWMRGQRRDYGARLRVAMDAEGQKQARAKQLAAAEKAVVKAAMADWRAGRVTTLNTALYIACDALDCLEKG